MFVLVEKLMNGTVTLDTYITIFDFENFGDAVDKVKERLIGLPLTVHVDNPDVFSYTLRSHFAPLHGYIKNKKVNIIREEK
jgi:hypothetical protein